MVKPAQIIYISPPSGMHLLGYIVLVALIATATAIITFTILVIPFFEKTLHIQKVEIVSMTAYTASIRETDNSPYTTASNLKVAEGSLAVSQDLFDQGWVYGKKVLIRCREGRKEAKRGFCGIFIITDLMNGRFRKKIDIYFHRTRTAKKFGHRERIAILLAM